MANEYYDHTTFPSFGTSGSSAAMRAELDAIEAGFAKLPVLAGNAGRPVRVNAAGNGLEASPLVFTNSTSVGIGTNTPRAELDIGTSDTGSTTIGLHIGFSAGGFYGWRTVNVNTPSTNAAGSLKFQRGDTTQWLDVLELKNNGAIALSLPASAPTVSNGQLTISLPNNNTLRFTVQGTDGGIRSADLTLP